MKNQTSNDTWHARTISRFQQIKKNCATSEVLTSCAVQFYFSLFFFFFFFLKKISPLATSPPLPRYFSYLYPWSCFSHSLFFPFSPSLYFFLTLRRHGVQICRRYGGAVGVLRRLRRLQADHVWVGSRRVDEELDAKWIIIGDRRLWRRRRRETVHDDGSIHRRRWRRSLRSPQRRRRRLPLRLCRRRFRKSG